MKASYLVFTLFFITLSCSEPKELENHDLQLSSGEVIRFEEFQSEFVNPRNIDVWLPDGYSDDEKYAVLYMHDGQMLYDSTSSWNGQEWGVEETMSKLIKEDKIRRTIVVGIWNTELRHSEYFPQKPFEKLPQSYQDSLIKEGKRNQETALFKTGIKSDDYLSFLVKELKPFIDSEFSTLPDQENTFIAGSSMGGLISMYALCEYPDVFQGAGCLSTHWIGIFDTLNNPIPEKFAEYLAEHLPKPQDHKIYFDFGTTTLDAFYEPYQIMVDTILVAKGYSPQNWKTLKFEGENHSENAWKKRLAIPMEFLLGE